MEDVKIYPVIKAPGMPGNVKQEDNLLNKTDWNKEDRDGLCKILDNYIDEDE